MGRNFAVWLGICALFYVFAETWFSLVLGVLLLLVAAFKVVVTVLRFKAITRFFLEALDNRGQLRNLRGVTGRLFRTQRTATYAASNHLFLFVGVPYLFIALSLGLNWWSVPIVLAAFLFDIGSRQLFPPVAMFLSTSNPDQIDLCTELQYRLFRLRVVNMLSVEAIAVKKDHEPKLAALDGYRLAKSAN